VAVVPREATGQVNRALEDVTDGADPATGWTWLLTMPSATTLSIELVHQSGPPGPCSSSPTAWQLSAAATTLVR
jgi:hypothetical protein